MSIARIAARLAAVVVLGAVAAAQGVAADAGTTKPGTTKPGAVQILNAYSNPTPPGAAVGAVFLEIRSAVDDRLLDVKSSVGRRAEVHATTMDGGVMRMRRAGAVAVRAGVPLVLEPGELHLMLYGLAKPLVAGQKIPLELRFEKAGVVRAEAVVQGDGGDAHR